MPARDGIDVADLPTYSFGHRGPIWWGNLGYLAIEGTAFALGIVVYLYYRVIGGGPWPPYLPPPDLLWGTLNLVLFLVSIPPNHWAKKAAESEDLWGVRRWLLVSLGFGAAILAVRGVEFTALNCRWDDNAYGSIVWILIGLHSFHLITEIGENAVLTTLMWVGPVDGQRYVDVSENQLYWYFVVAGWIVVYTVLYLVPRWS